MPSIASIWIRNPGQHLLSILHSQGKYFVEQSFGQLGHLDTLTPPYLSSRLLESCYVKLNVSFFELFLLIQKPPAGRVAKKVAVGFNLVPIGRQALHLANMGFPSKIGDQIGPGGKCEQAVYSLHIVLVEVEHRDKSLPRS